MHDVAAFAGVSHKTVSRVVNGDPYVSDDMLARVTAAIDAVGYRRNEFARQLRQGSTNTISFVMEDVSDPFYSVVTRAAEEVAAAREVFLVAASSEGDPARAVGLVNTFNGRQVEGQLLTPTEGIESEGLATELRMGAPLVFIDRPVRGLEADTVLADNAGGTRLATEHLLAHGHRRIAYLGDNPSLYTARERASGYRAALEAAGAGVDERLIHLGTPNVAEVDAVLARLLDLDPAPTALITGNNRLTHAALRTGRRILQRLALVGFDDFELADVLDPPVTVVAQDASGMGRRAAELLFDRIAGDSRPPENVTLPVRLIERGSGERPPASV
ncbi:MULTISPECIES: LacI family DNA-binding transcriptional regulator [unclassified Pseudactinotalea]|uniref:LacI family DNA-binding transcriptional regulator n=1 Tax=unclassified Pseudactinotalea TaxID=2649176 RepID=UPI00128D70FD|nr:MULTISPECIES: LacI family DNA-binding transcriptional regulator [unclassified Pseudactinotalea]MPV49544.1 LacI family DNA-binding transcriptional regulator [Pseudactinotalea sp. HY160]QGH71034.1 LacI family DNA-binding transcriptional regulator [Pseudactinotalea sp. HY158]